MDVLYERCCGLDIHKKTVVACVVVPGAKGRPHKEIRFAEALERLELEALPASGDLRESSTGGSQMDLCLAQLGRIEEAREGLPEEPGSGRMERRHRTPV